MSDVKCHLTVLVVTHLNVVDSESHIPGLEQRHGGDKRDIKEEQEDRGIEEEEMEEKERRIDKTLLASLSSMAGSALVRMAR